MKPTLLVMAKAPLIGKGKVRLAAEIGRIEAWRINRKLNAHTFREVRDARWTIVMCVHPPAAVTLNLPGVWPTDFVRVPQASGDLGAKLARALARRRRVAVIGTDCPALRRSHIAMAFDALRRAPYALGPADDGGFWLLAARSGAAAARAMIGVRWSTSHAAADVIGNLGRENVALLPTLRDVDTAADLRG